MTANGAGVYKTAGVEEVPNVDERDGSSREAANGSPAAVDPRLVELLICPACGGDIELAAEGLGCAGCRRVYPIRDGIPVMLVEAATAPAGGEGHDA